MHNRCTFPSIKANVVIEPPKVPTNANSKIAVTTPNFFADIATNPPLNRTFRKPEEPPCWSSWSHSPNPEPGARWAGSGITGSALPKLSGLTRLAILTIESDKVTDATFQHVGQFQGLHTVIILGGRPIAWSPTCCC